MSSGESDRPGAGGGWFGGFAGQHGNGGSGGGSSFALTYDAQYPRGMITVHDDLYNEVEHGYYAFKRHEYLVTNAVFEQGIWYGNGKATITTLSLGCKFIIKQHTCGSKQQVRINFIITIINNISS